MTDAHDTHGTHDTRDTHGTHDTHGIQYYCVDQFIYFIFTAAVTLVIF